MSDLIDKKALLFELELAYQKGICPGKVITEFKERIQKGEFDAKPKPEPDPRPAPNEKIRSLPLGETKIRQYNMTSVDGKLAYLVDITDLLLGFRNTHFDKDHKPLEKRVEQIEKQNKPPCSKPWATMDCYNWCMGAHVCKYETRGDK